jgi:protein-S-isoprenylcysteine O-methyltransferase Ste14
MEITPGIRRYILKQVLYLVLVMVALFLGAGTLGWVDGWVLAIIIFMVQSVTGLLLYQKSPELLEERSKLQTGTKTWDVILSGVMAFSTLIMSIFAGLTYRWLGGGFFPAGFQLFGCIIGLAGCALTTWAMYTNPFFSGTVRIQTDRDHQVVSQGPYRYVRHPGYLGVIAFYLAMPFILRLPMLILISGLLIFVAFLRTKKEDQTLIEELPGYYSYSGQTHYRLIPRWW